MGVVIAVLVAGGVYAIYRAEMIRDAEVLATSLSQALIGQERDVLLKRPQPGTATIGLADEHFEAFDRRLRRTLQPFGIYKIKLYDAEARIVYSTDVGLIGRSDPDNATLRSVLASGHTVSLIKRKGQVQDLGGGVRFDIDVVETYVAVRNDSRVIGSFELYLDLGRHSADLGRKLIESLGVVYLVIAAALAVLYACVRHGAVRYAAALTELARRESVDPLTGALHHRVAIDKATAMAADGPLCLGLIEIDQFAALVDAGSPAILDDVLFSVSEAIRGQLGADDLLGRHRGGTFVGVFGGAELTDAVLFGERIRRAVAGLGHPLTVSIGIAQCASDTDVPAAIQRAEEALRRARTDGRDCVRVAA
ncbi:MAG TPA: GGDEF domain-containing protein [Azospirillum sp.]|nr:GGDEF domain-containing protein [Azospirillum sp.]